MSDEREGQPPVIRGRGRMLAPRVRVLCYHSNNVSGTDYRNNDHIALAEDLRTLIALGVNIVPLQSVVAALNAGENIAGPAVALSCDDGSWFDWYDLEHPTFGLQASFRSIIESACEVRPALQISSFVIASPKDRRRLDQTCLAGMGWWGDDWWSAADSSGVMLIENHSWDHNHETLAPLEQFGDISRGGFSQICFRAAADFQIHQSQVFLNQFRSPRPGLFAYPYGECNDFLVEDYFPRFGSSIGIAAAFTTEPAPVDRNSNRWKIPRYVCGWHWKSTEELIQLLCD